MGYTACALNLNCCQGDKRSWFYLPLQGPTVASQQMDDLFDVLIESGGEKYRAYFSTDDLEAAAPVMR